MNYSAYLPERNFCMSMAEVISKGQVCLASRPQFVVVEIGQTINSYTI
jgi:hypothetical protein